MRIASFLFLLVFLSLLFTGCHTKGYFDGMLVADGKGFRMDYSMLDGTEEVFLFLEEGDELEVRIAQERGSVSVTVGTDRGSVYRGTGLTDAVFTLIIPQTGEYHICVTGKGSRGSICLLTT